MIHMHCLHSVCDAIFEPDNDASMFMITIRVHIFRKKRSM